jgi:hypothetical protein
MHGRDTPTSACVTVNFSTKNHASPMITDAICSWKMESHRMLFVSLSTSFQHLKTRPDLCPINIFGRAHQTGGLYRGFRREETGSQESLRRQGKNTIARGPTAKERTKESR